MYVCLWYCNFPPGWAGRIFLTNLYEKVCKLQNGSNDSQKFRCEIWLSKIKQNMQTIRSVSLPLSLCSFLVFMSIP